MKNQLMLACLLTISCALASAEPATPQASRVPPAAPSAGSIDINTATLESLQSDLGLSQAEANAIIEYRKKKGPLSTEAQLRAVPGLKAATFNKMKGRVTFSNPVLDTSGRSVETFVRVAHHESDDASRASDLIDAR